MTSTEFPIKIEIIRSEKRKKTISAKLVKDKIVICIPTGLSENEESMMIDEIVHKLKIKRFNAEINDDGYLIDKFNEFNRKYFQGKLEVRTIKFVSNQHRKLGSCTPILKTIRISDKLIKMPKWVLDYVIMHEMTHLVYLNHSKEFWNKVNEYKYSERSRGFLIAKGLDEEDSE
ncbi:MAG: M48 family metallopeptidase [Candidatus Thermoplasmatota archaeon]|jgi:predicted metal-dependent hydrolase|nr:M48 family metallopeptidase [Candidatus Thermoplasmatota archaeon]MCL5963746.1 M48 family metallopeptidase [Candidatus Thermoplasmatota archaeon]